MKKAILSFVAAVSFLSSNASQALPLVSGFNVGVYADVPQPMKLSFGSDGSLYVGRHPESLVQIHKVGAGGGPVVPFGPPMFDPDAVLFDATGAISGTAGSVLVGGTGPSSGVIAAIRPDATSSVVFNSGFSDAREMKFDSSGRLLFADDEARVLVSTGSTPTTLFNTPALPSSIAIDVANRIFTSLENGTIVVNNADGSLANAMFASGLAGDNTYLAFGPGGAFGHDLYVLSGSNLLRFDMAGNSTLIGTGFDIGPGSGTGFIFGPDNALYVSEFNENHVLRISAIPEPSMLLLLSSGMAGLLVCSKRRSRSARRFLG